jgi:lipoprotein NlpI
MTARFRVLGSRFWVRGSRFWVQGSRFWVQGSGFLVLLCVFAVIPVRAQDAQDTQAIFSRAVTDFTKGRFAESAAGFDTLAKLAPDRAPHLWQRGIALYYAGRYDDCRRQFESHRTVNPDDVENAVWHFLCVARASSPQRARTALLPVGPDPRVPMREIYEMFRGRVTPPQVISAAAGDPEAQFYAHLYVGLYFDALGMGARALEHIKLAAADQFAPVSGYMHMVARVHLNTLER